MDQLKRHITPNDVIIYDKNIDFTLDERKAGYNIGNLLNMPYLSGQWTPIPGLDECSSRRLDRMNLVADICKDSILHIYCNYRPFDEKVPCGPRIMDSVKKYMEKNKKMFETNEIFKMVQNPRCLCVHIRSAELNVEQEYVSIIEKLSHLYDKIILLGGIHLDRDFRPDEIKTSIFAYDMNRIMDKNSNIFLYLDKPDIHLCLMHKAANLLVHKGGFSCLGSIVCKGTLFLTNLFEYLDQPNWIEIMEGRKYGHF